MADDFVELADAITLLRDQIAEARSRLAAGGDGGVRFGLGEITVELGVELARTTGGTGGLRFGVVGIGAEFGGKLENASRATHKLIVKLNPRSPAGGDIDVHDVE